MSAWMEEMNAGTGKATDANFARVQNEKQAAATQVGGDHYKRLAVQPWAAMESWMTPEQFKGFLTGNVIKYMARDKGDIAEDHRKAAHYLQKLIEVESGNGK